MVSVAYNQEALPDTLLYTTQAQGRRTRLQHGFTEQVLSFKEVHGPVASPRLRSVSNCVSLGASHNVSKHHFRSYIKMAITGLPFSGVGIKAKRAHGQGRVWPALSCCPLLPVMTEREGRPPLQLSCAAHGSGKPLMAPGYSFAQSTDIP